MSHDIACRITLFPPVRTAYLRPGRFLSFSQSCASDSLEGPQSPGACTPEHPQALGKPHGKLLGAHLHFIAHPAKSEREERKESGGVANEDNQTRKFPETERAANVD
jgi:hypothetical protein